MSKPVSFPDARFPMIRLYESMILSDERRLARAHTLANDPALVADAFVQTRRTLAQYVNTEPFYDRRPEPQAAAALDATKDVALRLAPAGRMHTVERSEDLGLRPRELNFVYLDRELVMLRTTRSHRQADFSLPEREMRMDLLLCAQDGTPIVGEIKVKRDRDLSYP